MFVAVNCSERKKPPISSTSTMRRNGVAGVNSAQAAVNTELMIALVIRIRRKPKRRMIRAASDFIVKAPTADVNVSSPDSNGE